ATSSRCRVHPSSVRRGISPLKNFFKKTKTYTLVSLCLLCLLLRLLLLGLRHPLLHAPGEMRNNAEHALDQHELPTMMHLMFFNGHDHIETGALRRCAARRRQDTLAQEVL